LPAEREIIQVAKADDLFACDPAGRPKIDRDGSSVRWDPGDRTPERSQKQKPFSFSFPQRRRPNQTNNEGSS